MVGATYLSPFLCLCGKLWDELYNPILQTYIYSRKSLNANTIEMKMITIFLVFFKHISCTRNFISNEIFTSTCFFRKMYHHLVR